MKNHTDPYIPIIQHARELRRNQTNAEKLLWKYLRNRQLSGYKFRRQYPILKYIIDFYCAEARLGIELDGDYHLHGDQPVVDTYREEELKVHSINIIRFSNEQIFNNLETVLYDISKFCENNI